MTADPRDCVRRVRSLPLDKKAAAVMAEWESSGADITLDATCLDLTGADFSRADFANGMLFDAVLRGVRFTGADLYRAHLEGSDLSRADLSDCWLAKAVLDEALLRGANLEGANLGSAELYQVDATDANFRNCRLNSAMLLSVQLRGADLSHATVDQTSFQVVMDDRTVVEGLEGTVFGPAHVTEGDQLREISGAELERWLNDRGARVRVIGPLHDAAPAGAAVVSPT